MGSELEKEFEELEKLLDNNPLTEIRKKLVQDMMESGYVITKEVDGKIIGIIPYTEEWWKAIELKNETPTHK